MTHKTQPNIVLDKVTELRPTALADAIYGSTRVVEAQSDLDLVYSGSRWTP